MQDISINTLMLAITALSRELNFTTQRINNEPPEVDEQEHLSEHVLDLQKALNEMANHYEKLRSKEPAFPPFDDLV